MSYFPVYLSSADENAEFRHNGISNEIRKFSWEMARERRPTRRVILIYDLIVSRNIAHLPFLIMIFFLFHWPMFFAAHTHLITRDMLPLPYATKENYKVILYRLADCDPEKVSVSDPLSTIILLYRPVDSLFIVLCSVCEFLLFRFLQFS